MENRVKKLEMITERLVRRQTTKSFVIIPPIPISSVVVGDDVKGSVLKYMFPCDGVVTKGMLKIDHKPKKLVSLNISIFNELGSVAKGFTIERKETSQAIQEKVSGGDCLDITISSEEEIITEVWISFLFVPTVKDSVSKNYLIDELDKEAENIKRSTEA